MKVLLVGAAGTVGSALHKELAERGHQIRCVDLVPPRRDMADVFKLFGYDPKLPDSEWIIQDVTQPGAAETALKGVDAVAYAALSLAINDATVQFSVNLAAPHSLARACGKCQVAKFVYASTVSVNGPVPNATVTEQTRPHLWGSYNVSKWLAEAMLREYANQTELRTIALRLGTVRPHLRFRAINDSYNQVFVDVRDVARAFRMALEDQLIRHDVLHVVSQGSPVYCDPNHAKETLGFVSEFNGPEHFATVHRKELAFWSMAGAHETSR